MLQTFDAFVSVFLPCRNDVRHHIFQTWRAVECEWLPGIANVVKHGGKTQRVIGVQMCDKHGSDSLNSIVGPGPCLKHPPFDAGPGIEDVNRSPYDNADTGARPLSTHCRRSDSEH